MRKGIVLLIVALMCSYSVFASKDTVPPAVVAATPTVTLSQEQFDSLIAVSAKVNQMEYVSKTDCDSMFSNYINHVGWVVGLFGVLISSVVGLFGVLCTILVAIVGVAVPILLNRKFEDDIKGKIAEHDKQLIKTKEEIIIAKESAEQNAKDAKVNAYFSQAYYEESLDKRIELYTKVIDENPECAEAFNNRGYAYYNKGDNVRAIIDCSRSIDLSRENPLAYINRGIAYCKMGGLNNLNQAIKDFDEALRLNSDDSLAYNNRGVAYMRRGNDGDYDHAMNDFNTGLSLNPGESTRKMLERNIEELKAKMQQPKEGE